MTDIQLPMPNYPIFLALGLGPLPELEGQDDCIICTELYKTPVRTPCNHVFCAECLVRWLGQGDTCPFDRRQFFLNPLPDDESMDEDDEDEDEDEDVEIAHTWSFPAMDWPADIEPMFNGMRLSFDVDDEFVHSWLDTFDKFVEDARAGSSIVDLPIPETQMIQIAYPSMSIALLVAITRLASNPIDDDYMHNGVRDVWRGVFNKLDLKLSDMLDNPPQDLTLASLRQKLVGSLGLDHMAVFLIGNEQLQRHNKDRKLLLDFLIWSAAWLNISPRVTAISPPESNDEQWPESIEPFENISRYPAIIDKRSVVRWIHRFEHITSLNYNIASQPCQHLRMVFPTQIVQIDPELDNAVLGAVFSLASQSGNSDGIHEICREYWRTLSDLIASYIRISRRRVMTVEEFRAVIEPLATNNVQLLRDALRRWGLIENDEVRKFASDTETVLEWVVWNAVQFYGEWMAHGRWLS